MILELLVAAGAAWWIFKSSGKRTERPNETSNPTTPVLKVPRKPLNVIEMPTIVKQRATDSKSKIADIVQSRNIKYLVHFTQAENLPSIKNYGLMSRRDLEASALSFKFNDVQRFDGYPNSVSLSVTSTNYKMFWSLRKKNPSVKWAVILLDAYGILQNYDCAFQSTNAASNAMRNIPIAKRKTLEAFETMFYDDNVRKIRDLKDNEPTDPQAEILCFDTISPKFFKEILFDGELFAPRHDYRYWKKNVNE